jgi:hypothetical protein
MTLVLTVLLGLIAGAVSWYVTNFYANPILEFQRLRGRIRETLLFIAGIFESEPGKEECRIAAKELRHRAAEISALRCTTNHLVIWFWKRRGYDPEKAAQGLFALSHDLNHPIRHVYLDKVETNLKLPRSRSEEYIQDLNRRWQTGQLTPK